MERAGAHWRLRTQVLELDRPLLMGVLNVTPDSFSDGGRFLDAVAAIEHGRELRERGADIVDVGGESTRPGSAAVPADEEVRRVLPVVRSLASEGIPVSIDTGKPEVAERALEAGAEVINDVTGLGDPRMRRLAAEAGAGVVIMHMLGTPRTMQDEPCYDDVVREVETFLLDRAASATRAGVRGDSIVIDPGIGFGKTVGHNVSLLADLGRLASHGYPVLVGTSRKSFLGAIAGVPRPADRDLVTAVSVALAIERGASIVRVHDVAAAREAAAVATAIVRGHRWQP